MTKQQIADVLFSDDRVFVPAKLFKKPEQVGGCGDEIRNTRKYVLTAVEADQSSSSIFMIFADDQDGKNCGFLVRTDD